MNAFEELTSLTALLDDEPQTKGQVTKKPKGKQRQSKQSKRKSYTSTIKAKPEPVADSPKIMTSIIISEDLRDWLKLQSVTSKLSMSQQIEVLVRKEMKRQTKD